MTDDALLVKRYHQLGMVTQAWGQGLPLLLSFPELFCVDKDVFHDALRACASWALRRGRNAREVLAVKETLSIKDADGRNECKSGALYPVGQL